MRISARVKVLDEQVTAAQKLHHALEQQIELIGIEGKIRITPVHFV